jgi:Tat protein secretion system quality control protein TatD with DNase activity
VESDSPDHPPRGWPHDLSEPAAIEAIVQELGELRKEPVEFIKKQTARNALRLFDLKEST